MSSQVNKLPPEIISYVARFFYKNDDVDARSIIPLTHVCRYWRDSIISTPDNWTLIFSERRDLAVSSLQRAKAAPLTIHLNLDKLKKDPGFLDFLLPHVQHTTSLSVFSFFTAEELAKALPDFPRSMPNLRSLKLGKSGQADWSLLVGPFDFSVHTLKVLSLDNIPLFPSIFGLKTLTELSLRHHDFNLHLDTLLDFLEENRSLESATLEVSFADASLRHSQRRAPIGNQLRHLSIYCDDAMDGRALISGIALRKGADLQIRYSDRYSDEREGLADILAGVSLTHLPSLSSPTFMEYRSSPRIIRLLGPGGSFSYEGYFSSGVTFREFTVLPLEGIRDFRLRYRASWIPTKLHLSSFPSLEVFVIDASAYGSTFSTMLQDHASPSLKTLVFLDCLITEDSMAELTRFASDRGTTSASLNRVVMVGQSDGFLPTAASVERLRKHVPVVEVMEGAELPKDLL